MSESVKDFYIQQEVKNEALQQGFQEGFQQGFQEGIQQGIQQWRQQRLPSLVLRTLKRSIGELPTDIQKQVVSLSPEYLKDLVVDMFDFSSLNNLVDWLETLHRNNS